MPLADAILRRIGRRGNSKAHVCRPLGEPFWKLARCHWRISVPSLVVLSTRGARESSKIKSRGFRPLARRKGAGQLLLRTSHAHSCNTVGQWFALKRYRYHEELCVHETRYWHFAHPAPSRQTRHMSETQWNIFRLLLIAISVHFDVQLYIALYVIRNLLTTHSVNRYCRRADSSKP